MARTRVTVALYLLSLFLIGVGYMAIMPPFEGFDEPQHYASVRQIADTGTIPLFGKSYLPQDVADYEGPASYSSLNLLFDSELAYAKFFAQPRLVDRFVQDYRRPQPHTPFIPSAKPNWEAQHPPLYYVMLAPVLRLVETTPFVTQILILRLVSYLLALVGVFFGLQAIPAAGAFINPVAAMTGFLLYPVMLPMFFPEFTRIGNDSLCLLLAGLAAWCMTEGFANERNAGWPAALGVSLGLGLLTKAFFLPITFVIVVFLLLRCWRSGDETVRRLRLRHGAIVLILAVLIGGGWYIYNFLVTGVLIGGDDRVIRHGGFLAAVVQKMSVSDLVRGVVVTFITWIWGGNVVVGAHVAFALHPAAPDDGVDNRRCCRAVEARAVDRPRMAARDAVCRLCLRRAVSRRSRGRERRRRGHCRLVFPHPHALGGARARTGHAGVSAAGSAAIAVRGPALLRGAVSGNGGLGANRLVHRMRGERRRQIL
jgi:hypothetical protein